jgi:hypothetical protein
MSNPVASEGIRGVVEKYEFSVGVDVAADEPRAGGAVDVDIGRG